MSDNKNDMSKLDMFPFSDALHVKDIGCFKMFGVELLVDGPRYPPPLQRSESGFNQPNADSYLIDHTDSATMQQHEGQPHHVMTHSAQYDSQWQNVNGVTTQQQAPFLTGMTRDEQAPFPSGATTQEQAPFPSGASTQEQAPFPSGPTTHEQAPFPSGATTQEQAPFPSGATTQEQAPFPSGASTQEQAPFPSGPTTHEQAPFQLPADAVQIPVVYII